MHDTKELFQDWLTDNNKALPSVTSEKVTADREAEYLAITALADEFNAANVRSHLEYKLGELTLNKMFGPVAAETILQGIETVAQNNKLLARLLKHMGAGADGVDVGNEHATALLDQLQSLNIFTAEQRAILDNNRTTQAIISYTEAWNIIHTRK